MRRKAKSTTAGKQNQPLRENKINHCGKTKSTTAEKQNQPLRKNKINH
jgi:hypothetical protein